MDKIKREFIKSAYKPEEIKSLLEVEVE